MWDSLSQAKGGGNQGMAPVEIKARWSVAEEQIVLWFPESTSSAMLLTGNKTNNKNDKTHSLLNKSAVTHC